MRAFIGATILLLGASTPVYAQDNCFPRDEIMAALKHGNMTVVGQGENGGADAGLTTEVFALPDGKWIIIVNRADGISCMVAGGLGWTPPPIDTKSGTGI